MPYFDEYAGFDQNMKEETPPSPEPVQEPENGNTIAHTVFDYAELLIFTIVFVLLATTFFFRHAVVVGPSMQHTLENGEHLIISDLFYTPTAGDIVVLEDHDATGITEPIIKRIVATEGDTVEIREDGVYVNGVHLDEDYAYEEGNPSHYMNDYLLFCRLNDRTGAANEDGSVYTYHVGEGEVFVIGDNRFNSTDSRAFGAVSENGILGRVVLRITPFERFGGVD